jgi:hypothetical protein
MWLLCFNKRQTYGLLVVATAFLFALVAIAVLAAFSPWQAAAVPSAHLPSDIAFAHSAFVIDEQAVLPAQHAFGADVGAALVVEAVCALPATAKAAKAAIRNNFFILNLVFRNLK